MDLYEVDSVEIRARPDGRLDTSSPSDLRQRRWLLSDKQSVDWEQVGSPCYKANQSQRKPSITPRNHRPACRLHAISAGFCWCVFTRAFMDIIYRGHTVIPTCQRPFTQWPRITIYLPGCLTRGNMYTHGARKTAPLYNVYIAALAQCVHYRYVFFI